jgi:hypothetical protein
MKTEQTQDRQDNRGHQHYTETFTGDGVKTTFALAHNYSSTHDVQVHVSGGRKRADEPAGAKDYSLRGVTHGFDGDKNMIKFAAAPGAGADIVIDITGT